MVTMTKETFDNLEDAPLIWACIEPEILKARGRNFAVKSEVYSLLTESQRALFMFQVMYGHIHEADDFNFHMAWLLSNKGVWLELKKAIEYFKADAMLDLLNETGEVYNSLKDTDLPGFEKSMSRLGASYIGIIPETVKLTASRIRSDPGEFVQFIG